MERNRFCRLLVFTLLGYAPFLFAQSPPNRNTQPGPQGGTSSGQTAVLRTTTRLVQLNVIVQNKNGQVVRGLNKDDFVLLDNGKPQNIALFSNETMEGHSSNSTELASAVALPPDVFGNRVHHQEEVPGSVTVILFDALNTSFKDQAYAKKQILAFLRQLQPQDHVAIYLLTRQLTVINEFTQDSRSLLQAIERFQAEPSLLLKAGNPEYVVGADMGVQNFKAAQHLAMLMNETSSNLSDTANLDRVQITAQAITAIANHVAGIPGRKNLVWVSGGFPISISFDAGPTSPVDTKSQNFGPVLEGVARSLNQANLAIYPVDARGLFVPGETDASIAHPFGPYSPPTDIAAGQEEQATMDMIARNTGGRAYYNTNDIKGAIRRTLSDSSSNYLVGFYPDHGNWDGQFHELKLHVKTTGLVLRYRKGYFAFPTPTDSAAEARSALQAALWSPVDATSLGILAKVDRMDNQVHKLDLLVKLDTRELVFNDTEASHAGSVDAIYLQLGPGDAVLAVDPLTYKLSFDEKTYKAVLNSGYILKASLVIRPSTRELRIIVRDSGSGALGSVTVPLARFLPPEETAN